MKIERKQIQRGFEIDVKRFYVPFVVHEECPGCGEPSEKDLTIDYLGYPSIDYPERLYMYCDNCDHEWDTYVILRLTVEEASKP